MSALVAAQLSRPPPLAARLGAAARPLVGLHRLDLPLGRRRARQGGQQLPAGAEGGVRDRRADQRRAVPARRDAEPDRAARARLPRRARGRQRALRRRRKRPPRRAALGAGLAPRLVAAGFARDRGRAGGGAGRHRRSHRRSAACSPAPASPSARPSPASPTSGRWRCCSPGSASSPPASRCAPASSPARSPGVLVAMYVIDLVGRLDPEPRRHPLRLGLPLLRQRDRRRHRPARLLWRYRRRHRLRRSRRLALRTSRPIRLARQEESGGRESNPHHRLGRARLYR